MRIPLRYFLAICFLIGAVALPLAIHAVQEQRAKQAETETLKKKLTELLRNEPSEFGEIGAGTIPVDVLVMPPRNPAHAEWRERVMELESRLKTLTQD